MDESRYICEVNTIRLLLENLRDDRVGRNIAVLVHLTQTEEFLDGRRVTLHGDENRVPLASRIGAM